jgi:hypothetical protein
MKELLHEAEARLFAIRQLTSELAVMEARADQAITMAISLFEDDIAGLKAKIRDSEKALLKFQKQNKAKLFYTTDRVEVRSGALLYQRYDHVTRIKGIVGRLEAAGFNEAVKTVKSADWDIIDKWDDQKLAAVGTERVPKEDFEYELVSALKSKKP